MFRRRTLACSFCRRSHTEVDKLVAGPRVYICDRCVTIAADMMREGSTPPTAPVLKCRGILTRLGSGIREIFGGAHRRTVAHAPPALVEW